MKEAWKLLKGNPDMRDAKGKSIDHTSPMFYANLAHQIHMNEPPAMQRMRAKIVDDLDDDKTASRVMEQMQQPIHRRRVLRRLEAGRRPTTYHDAIMASRRDEQNKRNLKEYQEEAAEQTRNTMEFGNENASGPNYDIQRMPRPEEE